MNILQVLPRLDVGGVERGTIDLARHLALGGHKAVVVSGGGRMVKALDEVGAKHYNLPIGAKNPFIMAWMAFKLADIIKRENIDVVHARSRVPAITAFVASRMTKRLFVTTAHGQYKKHLTSRAMGWGRVVIVASAAMARYMMENFDVPKERIKVISRGVDLAKFVFESPDKRTHATFTIGMISRITPLKGHLTFIQAMAKVARTLNSVKIIIAGEAPQGKEAYLDSVRLLVRRLALQDKVEFLGYREDVEKVLSGLDVFVSASEEQEAFARTVIEAQAAGVPCVATRVGGVIELVEDGRTGLLCNPKDPKDMAGKVLDLYRSPALRVKLAQRARLRVEKEFSLERMLAETVNLYEKCLEGPNILIIKISALGDVVLAIPSIRAVRKKFPLAKIQVLAGLEARDALLRCPYIDNLIVCDFGGRDRGFKSFLYLARRLVKEDFDIAIDLQNNKRSHLLSFLSLAGKRYGWDNAKFSFLLNHKIKDQGWEIDPVEHQFKVLSMLGIRDADKRLELWPGEEDRRWAEYFLKGSWAGTKRELAAINMEASPKWETKNWPVKNFIGLSNELARQYGMRPVLIGKASTLGGRVEEFVKGAKSKPIDARGKTDINQLAALLERCSLLITSDSAPMHIAQAVGTPYIALFGPTDPERHAVPSPKSVVIRKKVSCSPCYKPVCNTDFRCMKSITVEEVLERVGEIIKTA